jgi:branched-subunit amino acid ABC-type transport system permease component
MPLFTTKWGLAQRATLYNLVGVVKRHVDARRVLTFLFVEGFGVAVALGVALLMRPRPAFRILRWKISSTNHLSGH